LQRDVLDAEALAQELLQLVKRALPPGKVAHDHVS
jgi:hypothetical protein